MNRIKAVLFDLDGTLADTAEFVFQAYEYALAFHKAPLIKREDLSPMIGRGLHSIYSEIAPEHDAEVLSQTHVSFQQERLHLVKSFPDVGKVVKKLKDLGFKLAIVTSRMKNTEDTLKSAGMEESLFDVIVTADDVKNVKPDPEGVLLALKKLKVKAGEAIFVGDGSHDIEMAKNAKVKTVGVTYGFGGKNIKKSKPDWVINNIEELITKVLTSP